MSKLCLVTGSSGLIGSEVAVFFHKQGFAVHGADNNQREGFAMAEACSGRKQSYAYVDQARSGDHICYYSDLRKMRAHYPNWRLEHDLPNIFKEIAASWRARLHA